MKYDELYKIAESNEYSCELIDSNIVLSGDDEDQYIKIDKMRPNIIFIKNIFSYEWDYKVIKAAVEFAGTLPEERYDGKKYYLRHKFLGNCEEKFLNNNYEDFTLELNTKVRKKGVQTQFTEREIEDIQIMYNTTLDDFEQIEAEEKKFLIKESGTYKINMEIEAPIEENAVDKLYECLPKFIDVEPKNRGITEANQKEVEE